MTIDIKFIDSGYKSEEKPDPDFPNGRRINVDGPLPTALCCFNLPYPAPRCGTYEIECRDCPAKFSTPVNGRDDDPRVITMPCKRRLI
jgi:hypothetical protein